MTRFFFIALAVFALAPVRALAGDPAVDYPWLVTVLQFLESIPAVGNYLAIAVMVVGVVAGIFTVLATALDGVAKTLSVFSWAVGLRGFSDKVNAFHEKISPWLKWFSAYNVQKKPK